EGTKGLAIGDIGWCKDPYTSPSTIRYATIGDKEWHRPMCPESWFPDAFIGTMAQLLIALETGKEPAISGRDNLKTMALVEAAYLSAESFRSVDPESIARSSRDRRKPEFAKMRSFFSRLFSAPSVPVGAPGSMPGEAWLRRFTPRARSEEH